MIELKHTPGPWEKDYGITLGHIKSVPDKQRLRTPTVCKYLDWITKEILPEDEIEANGLLIAAAPEMIEALIEIYNDSFPGDSVNIHKIKIIIKKATGQKIEDLI